jgi:pimeloyl-ACP methyl ester carboxylesterase
MVPTTMVLGSEDRANLATTADNLDFHFTGRYTWHVIPGMGHCIQRENPQAAVETLLENR